MLSADIPASAHREIAAWTIAELRTESASPRAVSQDSRLSRHTGWFLILKRCVELRVYAFSRQAARLVLDCVIGPVVGVVQGADRR
jgi:hypothetical protein